MLELGTNLTVTEIDSQRGSEDFSVVVVRAHPDDEALGGGVVPSLAKEGARIVYATLSRGEARRINGYTPDDVAAIREKEDKVGAAEAGAAYIVKDREGIPDGHIDEHVFEASKRIARVILAVKPVLVFAPNLFDEHPDHRAGGRSAVHATKIVQEKLGQDAPVPVGFFDTISGLGIGGAPVYPTHYLVSSRNDVRSAQAAYHDHVTQTRPRFVSPDEMEAVRAVLAIPNRSGSKIGKQYASGLTLSGSGAKTLGKMYGRQLVVA